MKKTLIEITDDAIQGNRSPLEVYIRLKDIEQTLKECLAALQPLAVDEANKWTEKSFTHFGARIDKKNTPGTWKFTNLDAWKTTKETLKSIEEKAKEAFKAYEKGLTISDNDGVVIEPAEYTPGKETLAIKIL